MKDNPQSVRVAFEPCGSDEIMMNTLFLGTYPGLTNKCFNMKYKLYPDSLILFLLIMIIQSKLLDQVYLLDCNSFNDSRGSFTKLFQSKAFLDLGLDFVPAEIFVCRSRK